MQQHLPFPSGNHYYGKRAVHTQGSQSDQGQSLTTMLILLGQMNDV